ncbi:hypothetical protein MPH_13882 [Macrophomina phaseolina MS6]|uniref:Uncharacterized protein n=1 Tax=Macrophomina phaseolina (strain MS6) TaxID=1126212 RepID=K2RXJ6_MACPH|nr:hypothetical protein MPH_13882 [Macrophomina phaseolina MS6]
MHRRREVRKVRGHWTQGKQLQFECGEVRSLRRPAQGRRSRLPDIQGVPGGDDGEAGEVKYREKRRKLVVWRQPGPVANGLSVLAAPPLERRATLRKALLMETRRQAGQGNRVRMAFMFY